MHTPQNRRKANTKEGKIFLLLHIGLHPIPPSSPPGSITATKAIPGPNSRRPNRQAFHLALDIVSTNPIFQLSIFRYTEISNFRYIKYRTCLALCIPWGLPVFFMLILNESFHVSGIEIVSIVRSFFFRSSRVSYPTQYPTQTLLFLCGSSAQRAKAIHTNTHISHFFFPFV